jgi:hypothetical protein
MTEDEARELGYLMARQLPDGTWIALQRMAYTIALMVGLDPVGYESRYCYEHLGDAFLDYATWDGSGDPPGPWVKHKGWHGDRLNPRLKEEVF